MQPSPGVCVRDVSLWPETRCQVGGQTLPLRRIDEQRKRERWQTLPRLHTANTLLDDSPSMLCSNLRCTYRSKVTGMRAGYWCDPSIEPVYLCTALNRGQISSKPTRARSVCVDASLLATSFVRPSNFSTGTAFPTNSR